MTADFCIFTVCKKVVRRPANLNSVGESDERHPVLVLPPGQRLSRRPTLRRHRDRGGPVGRAGRGRDVAALPAADDDEAAGREDSDDGATDAHDAQHGQQRHVRVLGGVPAGI